MNENSSLRIYITGTPGTGKTTIAKTISNHLNLTFLELNELIMNEGLYLGYDIDRDTFIVDDELLTEELGRILEFRKNICISGGMVLVNLPFDYIIVLRSPISILRERLVLRGYSTEKIESNIEAEIMNVFFHDFTEFYPSEVIFEVLNDNRTIEEIQKHILSIIGKHHLGITK